MTNLCLAPGCCGDDQPRQILGGAFICSPCANRMARNIGGLATQFDELGLWLTRNGGAGGDKVSGTQATGLDLNERVSDHRRHMRGVASTWAKLVVEERGVNPPPTAEIHATAPFLVTHCDWLAHQPFAGEVYDEMAEARRRAFGLMNPPGRTPIRLDQCVEEPCTGDLWTIIRFEGESRPWCVWCDFCGVDYGTHQFLRLGERLERRRATRARSVPEGAESA